jgi:hypothetical protein
MKRIQKHSIVLSGFVICILLGYLAFQNLTPFQSDEVKNPPSQSDTGSITESHTGKILATASESGNQWGGNPFGTGKTGIEEVKKPNIQKVVFQKSNLEWKMRTQSGIVYVLGEGNPKEVAIPMDKIKDYYNCKPPYQNRNSDPSGDPSACPEAQYLTLEIEQALVNLLKSPLWEKVVTECRDTFQYVGGIDQFDTAFVTGNVLDINVIMTIDPDGRKRLNGLNSLAELIGPDMKGGGPGVVELHPASSCYMTRTILYEMLGNVIGTYNAGALSQVQ